MSGHRVNCQTPALARFSRPNGSVSRAHTHPCFVAQPLLCKTQTGIFLSLFTCSKLFQTHGDILVPGRADEWIPVRRIGDLVQGNAAPIHASASFPSEAFFLRAHLAISTSNTPPTMTQASTNIRDSDLSISDSSRFLSTPFGAMPNAGVNCLYGVLYIDIFWYQDSWH